MKSRRNAVKAFCGSSYETPCSFMGNKDLAREQIARRRQAVSVRLKAFRTHCNETARIRLAEAQCALARSYDGSRCRRHNLTAERWLLKALQNYDAYKGRRDTTSARLEILNRLAAIAHRLNDPERLQYALQRMLSTYRSLAESNWLVFSEDVSVTLWQLGNLHADMHRPQEAEKAYLEALNVRATFDDEDIFRYRPATAQCLRSLGQLYEEQIQDGPRAEESYKKAVEVLRELCSHPYEGCNHVRSLACSLDMLGRFYERAERKEAATACYEEAESLHAKIER